MHRIGRDAPEIRVVSWRLAHCDAGWRISLFGLAIRNLRESEADFLLEQRFSLVSFRLSTLLRNVDRHFAAGDTFVGFGPSSRHSTPGRCRRLRDESSRTRSVRHRHGSLVGSGSRREVRCPNICASAASPGGHVLRRRHPRPEQRVTWPIRRTWPINTILGSCRDSCQEAYQPHLKLIEFIYFGIVAVPGIGHSRVEPNKGT